MTHREGILTLNSWKKRVVELLNNLKPLSRCTVSKRLPIPVLYNMH